jgi:hypothetical protein
MSGRGIAVEAFFFQSQTRWMPHTDLVAASCHLTHLPLEWAVVLWQPIDRERGVRV